MSNKSIATIATMGIDIGKSSFHVVGLDQRGAIVLRQKWSRGHIETPLAAMPPCLTDARLRSPTRVRGRRSTV
jgi:transposase